ncbi:hypothetical protein TRICI_006315 [Trichomonascus ciferrii]|uniref:RRM domain-containing protein n=1 Tax=Trichomonascus ciferrii TaxID=44093 RepID=A0A642UIK4_9ASCO|nr:hypothetical protein TRICI_006315 [Trichomonascus ciferrii]
MVSRREERSGTPGAGGVPLSEEEYAQMIQQQQAAYAKPRAAKPAGAATTVARDEKQRQVTVKRAGGGKTWEDPSLLEWDPSHFRLFVGNLSPEVTDDMLETAFGRFGSMSKVKAVMDPKTGKNKGYGFVAFSDPEDYFRAFKEVNGKYIGNHPVQLKKANTEIKPTSVNKKKNKRHHPYKR